MFKDRYDVVRATVTGREHLLVHTGNQDATAHVIAEDHIFGVVADGCSNGKHSEFGALYAASWLASHAASLLRRSPTIESIQADLDVMITTLVANISILISDLLGTSYPNPRDLARMVNDRFLFTFLGFLVFEETCLIFGMGDGVYQLNDKLVILDSGEANEPTYLAYRLVPTSLLTSNPGALLPKIHHFGPLSEVKSLLIATDGLASVDKKKEILLKKTKECANCGAHLPEDDGSLILGGSANELGRIRFCPNCGVPLRLKSPPAIGTPKRVGAIEQFLDPRDGLSKNELALQRRLNVLGPVNHHLEDDTTLIVLTRR